MEKKILRILLRRYTKIGYGGGIAKVIFDRHFEEIAEEIVKLFDIPIVSRMYVVTKDYHGVTYYYISLDHWTPLFEGAKKFYEKPEGVMENGKYNLIEYYG